MSVKGILKDTLSKDRMSTGSDAGLRGDLSRPVREDIVVDQERPVIFSVSVPDLLPHCLDDWDLSDRKSVV